MCIFAFKTQNAESFFAVLLAYSWNINFEPKLCLHNLSVNERYNKLILES